ncbi:MAG: archease [Balneolaceae bacterium]|nr:archease [Balneolaceae bacterium]
MQKIEIIQHTADKGILVQGDTLEELFKAALKGMARIQKEEPAARADELSTTIQISAPDRTALLIDFLSEVHTLSDIHNTVFYYTDFKKISETNLEAQINGQNVSKFDEDIKAVTHSQADIQTNDEGLLETIVVFDI